MRACRQCGLSIGDTATFCMVCGTIVEAPASMASAASAPAVAPAPSVAHGSASVNGRSAGQNDGGSPVQMDAPSRPRHEAAPPLREAGRCEKTDPGRAAALYRDAILLLLESAADPLDHEGVRRDLLRAFDRLSLILKREGLPAEALEEIECASSLGLLHCQDSGIKGHREALRKRRESLRRALGDPSGT